MTQFYTYEDQVFTLNAASYQQNILWGNNTARAALILEPSLDSDCQQVGCVCCMCVYVRACLSLS